MGFRIGINRKLLTLGYHENYTLSNGIKTIHYFIHLHIYVSKGKKWVNIPKQNQILYRYL